jgi:hypothetical protein
MNYIHNQYGTRKQATVYTASRDTSKNLIVIIRSGLFRNFTVYKLQLTVNYPPKGFNAVVKTAQNQLKTTSKPHSNISSEA